MMALLLAGCGPARRTAPETPIGRPVEVRTPFGLPALGVTVTQEEVRLGERLFFDKRLSVDGTVSCATCHDPEKGFADGRRFSAGVGGKTGSRNAPTVINAAFQKMQFRDGRAASLEAQVLGPVTNPLEMAHSAEGTERSLAGDRELTKLFEAAYGPGEPAVTMGRVQRAIAAYERTLLRGDSSFDRFYFAGDRAALSDAARRGWDVFRDPAKGNCVVCHLVGEKSALFSDGLFHNLGAGMNAEGELVDQGRYEVTKRDADRGAFRTPGLREVSKTAPYMHDGSLRTLKEVVDFYIGGGNANPWLDRRMKPLTHLTRQERADLVAFLEAL